MRRGKLLVFGGSLLPGATSFAGKQDAYPTAELLAG